MSSVFTALQQTTSTVQDTKKDNVGIYNNANVTDIRMEPSTGRLQYSLDHGTTWYNSKEKWLNLFVGPTGSGGSLAELNFATHMDFPNIGDPNMLYVATDENVIYRWDANKMVYISLNSLVDINQIKVIQGII